MMYKAAQNEAERIVQEWLFSNTTRVSPEQLVNEMTEYLVDSYGGMPSDDEVHQFLSSAGSGSTRH